jgi:hypothetical protein
LVKKGGEGSGFGVLQGERASTLPYWLCGSYPLVLATGAAGEEDWGQKKENGTHLARDKSPHTTRERRELDLDVQSSFCVKGSGRRGRFGAVAAVGGSERSV